MMNQFTHYWYARGYFDGRCGHPDRTDQKPQDAKAAYADGYKVGDADWRQFDNPIATD